MKKLTKKIWLLFMAIVFAYTAKAQTTCTTSVTYSYPVSGTVTSYTNNDYWFKVTTPGAGNYFLEISNGSGTGKIDKAYAYTGSCASLSLFVVDSVADTAYTNFGIALTNTASATYYINLKNTKGTAITFSLSTVRQVHIAGQLAYNFGQSDTLSAFVIGASGTPSYTWMPGGANTAQIISTATVNTTYTLTYSDALGTLSDTATARGGSNPPPPPVAPSCQLVQNGSLDNTLNLAANFISNISFPTACQTVQQPFVSAPQYWIAPTCGTSDYYNTAFNAVNNGVGVPVNWAAVGIGTQPHSGNGYAGFYVYGGTGSYREYIQAPLSCQLAAGQLYNVSYWVSLASSSNPGQNPLNINNPSNNIGAYLSVTSVSLTTGSAHLPYTPQVNTTTPINNAGSWTQVSGTVLGGGSERYITLGNFYDDPHTSLYPSTAWSYYFVDDISVSPVTPTVNVSSCSSGSVTLTAYGAASANTGWFDGTTHYSGNPLTIAAPSSATTFTCTVTLSCVSCNSLTTTVVVPPPTPCSGTNPTYAPTSAYAFTASPGYAASNITVNSGILYTINTTELRMAAGTSITVASGGTLTVKGSWIHACNATCSSTNMWQGIIVQNGGTLNIITGGTLLAPTFNIIEDARRAVYTQNSSLTTPIPKWNIGGVIFNNDSIDIYIDAHPGDLSGNLINNSLLNGGCMFTCRNLSSHAVSASNYSAIFTNVTNATPLNPSVVNQTDFTIGGTRTLYGVFIKNATNANAVAIGSGSNPTNVFDNLDYGVYSTGSNVTIKNNRFQNITGNSNATLPIGIGVYAQAGTPQAGTLIVGNNSYSTVDNTESNNFINCLIGVGTYQINKIFINNNIFNNETTATTFNTSGSHVTGQAGVLTKAYAAYSNAITEQLQYANNNCSNYATGYYFDFQRLYNTASAGTYFYNNNITGASVGNQYCATGMYMQQSTTFGSGATLPWDAVSVSTNTITNITTNCISASAITTNSMVTVSNNTLTVQYNTSGTSTTNPPIAAVYVTGCNYFKVSNNPLIASTFGSTYGGSNAQYLQGIYIKNSTGSRITCNAVSHLGEDFVWYGNCAGSLWKENTMNISRYGLVLRSTGIMGDQGPDTHPDYNVWGKYNSDISSAQTLADNSDPSAAGASSKLHCLSTATLCTAAAIQKPCVNAFIIGTPYGSGTLIQELGSSPGLCTSEGGTGRMAAGSNNTVQDAVSDSVLLSLLNFTDSLPGYTSQTHWGMQYYVSSVKNTAAAVSGYENAKTFALIDAAIADTNYITAQTLLNGISTTNTIETNWKTIDNIIVATKGDSVNPNNISALQAVAAQCPMSGGNIVYRARAILNTYYGNLINYPNDCPANNGDEGNRTADIAGMASLNKNQSINLYPNPNNGQMQVDYTIKEDVDLQILDINGSLVCTYNLKADANTIFINNDALSNGVYFYRMVKNNKSFKCYKLVIIK